MAHQVQSTTHGHAQTCNTWDPYGHVQTCSLWKVKGLLVIQTDAQAQPLFYGKTVCKNIFAAKTLH